MFRSLENPVVHCDDFKSVQSPGNKLNVFKNTYYDLNCDVFHYPPQDYMNDTYYFVYTIKISNNIYNIKTKKEDIIF